MTRPPDSARPRPRPEPEYGARRCNDIIGDGAPRVEPPMLFDRRRLARALGISLRALDAMRARGLLPAPVRLGGRLVRWDRSIIARWIELCCPSRERFEVLDRARGGRP